ncbi:glutamate ABC transporter substrate-binding protein [Streptomyces sp. LX-29]|uniref:glutamate ABC transporter substrate-binding protein n=1 Tax=Streptomyces sp. LX-29 TaxID=2900152 RepID=UPI00240CF845|nr:glutamate ABC transporter substrate-binding protein [Streptomyces sp. LX-29]WFB09550.1 glutamate ABC transporter substrate-binding protein [Streptomyces sp. LX-29]
MTAGRSTRSALAVSAAALAVLATVLLPGALADGEERATRGGRAAHGDRVERAGHPAPGLPDGAVEEVDTSAADCERPEASLRPSRDAGDAIKRIKNREVNGRKLNKLIAGVDQNSYRWGYRDPVSGELTGFDIDLVRAIAKDLFGDPDAVIYRTIPTSQRIPALKEGKVDVVVRTMTVNCDRIKEVAFSTAYFTAGQQVLAPVRHRSITGYDDSLRGKRVCTAKGSTAEAALDDPKTGAESLGAIKVPPVPNQLDCLVRLQLGTVDAVITDSALAAGQAAQDPSVHLVGKPFTVEHYGVAMNKNDTDLVRRVNDVLDDYRDSGAWERAYRTWLAEDLGEDGATPPRPEYRD